MNLAKSQLCLNQSYDHSRSLEKSLAYFTEMKTSTWEAAQTHAVGTRIQNIPKFTIKNLLVNSLQISELVSKNNSSVV